MNANHSERGSALFIILIGVVLFAALAYAVGNMMKGGSPDTISNEKARLASDEILGYARSMRQAVQNMKISNGCADYDISFENAELTGYTHTQVAPDKCQVFNNSGGGMVYETPVAEWLDKTISPAPSLQGQWYFPANTCAVNTGSAGTTCNADATDNEALIAILPYIKKNLCIQINNALGVANPGGSPPQETGNAWPATQDKFTGGFSNNEKMDEGGNMAGCFEGAAGSTPGPKTYHFFQIILPR